jgi:sRNA-binding regulator protein Hfq
MENLRENRGPTAGYSSRNKAAGERVTAKHGGKSGSRAPETTFEEIKYLKHLIEHQTPIRVKLSNDEEVSGIVEYYDASFIRLTRKDGPNLFIFKHDIKYLFEEGS